MARTHPSDADLVDRLIAARRDGDATALSNAAWDLVTHHSRGIRIAAPAAWRSWGAEGRADYHQELLLRAHAAILRYDPTRGASVLTWVRRSLRGAAVDHDSGERTVQTGRDMTRVRGRIVTAIGDGVTDVDELAAIGGISRCSVLALLPAIDARSMDWEPSDGGPVPPTSDEPTTWSAEDEVMAWEAASAQCVQPPLPGMG